MNYYNEWDNFAAEWLRELIKDGLIPNGEVDTRSIADVTPKDLEGYTQCHFFAGIGGWSRALQLAGWRADRPVWTGSPPCQPFSVAGKQKGTDDERHLWPVWFNLVRKCRPPIIFGEQVSSAIRHGWLDSLQKDLEAENYACAAAVLPASSVGAFHKRDRLWIVAHAIGNRSQGWIPGRQDTQREVELGQAGSSSATNITMAYPHNIGHEWNQEARREAQRWAEYAGNDCSQPLGNTEHDGSYETEIGQSTGSGETKSGMLESEGSDSLLWGGSETIYCRDGKHRAIPTEPEIFPLANGIPNRVGILRGAGNAIVPQVAAEIIKPFV